MASKCKVTSFFKSEAEGKDIQPNTKKLILVNMERSGKVTKVTKIQT